MSNPSRCGVREMTNVMRPAATYNVTASDWRVATESSVWYLS
jgi:hypothetical protein